MILNSLVHLINNDIVRVCSEGIYYTEYLNIKNNSVYFGKTLIASGLYRFYKVDRCINEYDEYWERSLIQPQDSYYLKKEKTVGGYSLALYHSNCRLFFEDVKMFEMLLSSDVLFDLRGSDKILIQYLCIDTDSMK